MDGDLKQLAAAAQFSGFLSSQASSSSGSRCRSQPVSSFPFSRFLARWSRILTVPRDTPRMSAISWFFNPSRSLRIRAARYSSGRPSMKLLIHVFISLRIVTSSMERIFCPVQTFSSSRSSSSTGAGASAESWRNAALLNLSRATLVAML